MLRHAVPLASAACRRNSKRSCSLVQLQISVRMMHYLALRLHSSDTCRHARGAIRMHGWLGLIVINKLIELKFIEFTDSCSISIEYC